MSGPKAGTPILAKPYDEWLGLSTSPSWKNLKDLGVLSLRLLRQRKPIRLPVVDLGAQHGGTTHRDLVLSPDMASAIVKACKQGGFSVTSALHAALAKSVQVSELAAQCSASNINSC